MASPSTKAAIVSIVGASIYGFRRWREQQEQLNQGDQTNETDFAALESENFNAELMEDVPFSRSVTGQVRCTCARDTWSIVDCDPAVPSLSCNSHTLHTCHLFVYRRCVRHSLAGFKYIQEAS